MHCVRAPMFMKVCHSFSLFRSSFLTTSKLLSRLTKDLPPQAAGVLLKVFQCDGSDVVGRRAMHAAVHGCVLYVLFPHPVIIINSSVFITLLCPLPSRFYSISFSLDTLFSIV